jgi:RNA polymerase sigma factor (sigma-70 family)
LAPRREALFLGHADLVRRIACHLFQRRNYVDIDDLIQAGMRGLRAAVVGYERGAAKSFEGYATVYIREAMLEFVRKSDWSRRSGSRGMPRIEDIKASQR